MKICVPYHQVGSGYAPADLSKDVIDDLVILCKLVVGLAGHRWWLIIRPESIML